MSCTQSNKRSAIRVTDLDIQRGDQKVYDSLSLTIHKGEVVTIFGPNGCGKSTLLNAIVGTAPTTTGEVEVTSDNISYIFQNYRDSLLPWRTNYQNAVFPLEIQHVSKQHITERFEALRALLEITIDWHAYPYKLSGGQQQMLAFFRALITQPDVLLIDEAFSALDFENNLLLRQQLQQYYTKKKPTIVMVTHNIEEAVHMGSKIIILPRPPICTATTVHNTARFPRTPSYLASKDFLATKEAVLSAFQKAVHYA